MQTELIRRFGTGEVPIPELGSHVWKVGPNGSRIAYAPWFELRYDIQRAVASMDERACRHRSEAGPGTASAPGELGGKVERVRQSRFGEYTAALPLVDIPAVAGADLLPTIIGSKWV